MVSTVYTHIYYSTPHHHLWLIIVTTHTLSVEWSNNFLHLLRARWCTRCSFVLFGDQGYCWYPGQTVIEETLFSWSATVERAREIWPRELPGSFTVSSCGTHHSLIHSLSLSLMLSPSHSSLIHIHCQSSPVTHPHTTQETTHWRLSEHTCPISCWLTTTVFTLTFLTTRREEIIKLNPTTNTCTHTPTLPTLLNSLHFYTLS